MSQNQERKAWPNPRAGPDSANWVDVPEPGQLKGVFFAYADDQHLDIVLLWERIEAGTTHGYLGYYSWFSESKDLICVHMADPKNLVKKQLIEDNLKKIGAVNLRFDIKVRK